MGKITKPQRSRKHKKIKACDPFYTGNRQVDNNAYKFNRKPKHVSSDSMELSHSVRQIMRLKEIAKNDKSTKRKKLKKVSKSADFNDVSENLSVMERGVTRPMKPTPEFKQRRGESEGAFMKRVDDETFAVIQKAKFDDKYDVDTDELDQSQAVPSDSKKLNRLKKRKEKLLDKRKQKEEDRCGGFKRLQDNVQFGEVALQPPTLTARPKHGLPSDSCRPKTKSLLLTKYLDGTDDKVHSRQRPTKRRQLSMAEQVSLNAERQRVIQLYRDMKVAASKRST